MFSTLIDSVISWGNEFIDPNGNFFVEESCGHFHSSEEKKKYYLFIEQVEETFESLIDKTINQTKQWNKIWSEQKEVLLNKEYLWKQLDGTCFGNCSALAKRIMAKGKVLDVSELKEIESEETFSIEALAFQSILSINLKLYEMVKSYFQTLQSENGSKANLTEVQQNALGKRAKEFSFQEEVDCLATYPITFDQVGQLNEKDFAILKILTIKYRISWFELQNELKISNPKTMLKEKVLREFFEMINKMESEKQETFLESLVICSQSLGKGAKLLKNNPELIVPIESKIDVKNYFFTKPNNLTNHFNKHISNIKSENFSGVFMVSSLDSSGCGHMMLLEVDNDQQLYILYDNNRGFYRFKDLDSSLGGLAKCSAQYGTSLQVLPIVLSE